jgi:hypothetical protein
MTECCIADCFKKRYAHGLCEAHYYRLRRHGDPLGGRTSPGKPLEWVHQHKTYNSNDCLIWPFAAKDRNGYAMVMLDGKITYAHRIMCTIINGDPPTPLHEVAHSCGRGHCGCVNPTHLRWATRSENHADKLLHGTHRRGERCPTGKLTEDQVNQILALKGKMSPKDTAKIFDVSLSHICSIQKGRRWGWLVDQELKTSSGL